MALAVSALAGCGGAGPAAATIDGQRIAQSQLHSELDAIRRNVAALAALEQQDGSISGPAYDGFSSAFVAGTLTDEVDAQVVATAVAARHLTVPLTAAADLQPGPGFASYPSPYQEVLVARTANRLALAADLSHVDLSPTAIDRYYRGNPGEFTRYCVSGLAVGSLALATAARSELEAGTHLDVLARSESVDPGTAAHGGIIGCGDIGVFSPLASAITHLAPHTFSQPVTVGPQYWVVEVTTAAEAPESTVEGQVAVDLVTQYGPFNAFLDHSLSVARVTVDPGDGRWDASAQPPAVAPIG